MILYCFLTEALSLVTLHFSSPYGEPTSIECSFIHALLVPVNVPMIYIATLHLVMEREDHTIVSDEIIFGIKRKHLSILQYLIRLHQLPSPLIPAPQAFVFLLEPPYESASHKIKHQAVFLGHQCRLTVTGVSSRVFTDDLKPLPQISDET